MLKDFWNLGLRSSSHFRVHQDGKFRALRLENQFPSSQGFGRFGGLASGPPGDDHRGTSRPSFKARRPSETPRRFSPRSVRRSRCFFSRQGRLVSPGPIFATFRKIKISSFALDTVLSKEIAHGIDAGLWKTVYEENDKVFEQLFVRYMIVSWAVACSDLVVFGCLEVLLIATRTCTPDG